MDHRIHQSTRQPCNEFTILECFCDDTAKQRGSISSVYTFLCLRPPIKTREAIFIPVVPSVIPCVCPYVCWSLVLSVCDRTSSLAGRRIFFLLVCFRRNHAPRTNLHPRTNPPRANLHRPNAPSAKRRDKLPLALDPQINAHPR